MSDTQRTKIAILALLANNSTNNISAQDLRDAVVTVFGAGGGIVWNDNTDVSAISTSYSKIDTATSNMAVSPGGATSDFANSQIVCPLAGNYKVWFSGSAISSSNNVVVHSSVWVNGVETEIESDRKIATGSDVGSWSMSGRVVVGAGEAIDIRAKLTSGTTNLTLQHAQLWCELDG